jgi:hypothetical protein
VVSAALSFKLPPPDRAGPSTAPMEASDNPEIVQSTDITSDESVEPAVTAGVDCWCCSSSYHCNAQSASCN